MGLVKFSICPRFHHDLRNPEHPDDYLPHPAHKEVKELVVPHHERLMVFDFDV